MTSRMVVATTAASEIWNFDLNNATVESNAFDGANKMFYGYLNHSMNRKWKGDFDFDCTC